MTAPALVTAEEFYGGGTCPVYPESEVGKRLTATLRHYEAEVGRLGRLLDDRAKEAAETNRGLWRQIEGFKQKLVEDAATLAREAPFAALGREVATYLSTGVGENVGWSSWAAARAALSEEAEPGWSDPAPSGCRYQMRDGKLWRQIEGGEEYVVVLVSLPDIAFVAKLMESKGVTP